MVDSLGITSTSRHRYNWENFGNEEGQALNHAIQISGVRQALHNNVPRIRRIKQQESSSLTTEEIYLPITGIKRPERRENFEIRSGNAKETLIGVRVSKQVMLMLM